MVYSTCSVAVEENEAVVAYAMKKRFIRIETFKLDDGSTDVGRPVRFACVACVLCVPPPPPLSLSPTPEGVLVASFTRVPN